MKNAILITVLFFLAQAGYSLSLDIHTGDELKKTIILINGAPFLVDIDHNGKVVNNYLLVHNYFTSNDSHENLVVKAESEYEEEVAFLNSSRLIIFNETSTLLNEVAVNNIRDLANLYNRGVLQNVNITAGQVSKDIDEPNTESRINAITQLLRDFGVKEGDISADIKLYRSDLPNQFVKIDLLK
ncbi:MAG: hypothetical protein V3V00_09630 [Saprospiraceae bacterium]